MPYMNLKCKRGHKFRAFVASRYSRVECPECQGRQSDNSSVSPTIIETVSPSDYINQGSWDSSSDSSSSDTFSSGGGGDFGGGGADSSWD